MERRMIVTGAAMGVRAMPADYPAPIHSHRAEEFALVLWGKGKITVEGTESVVGSGSLVVTPPNAPHVTTIGPGEPVTIDRVHGPADSETRWQPSTVQEKAI
jgi:quercetin dioxygenase-like cupin family protein